jgi:hypothetical protein
LTVTARLRKAAMILIVVGLCSAADDARADYLFTPFVGGAFGGNTAFPNLEQGAGSTQLIFGGSVGWLSRGVFGVEADFGYAPRFFERNNRAGNIFGSNATTLSGSVIIAVPLSVTDYSLRPYLVGGLGLMHSGITYDSSQVVVLDPVSDNSLGLNVGGGAIGFLTPRTGLRFELRHFRTFERETNALSGILGPRLSFWRATIGVVIRY